MNSIITYEFPLNERIRVFIRLEQLFQQFNHFLSGATVADTRAAINTLLDIIMILRRNDLKSEILKELDRHVNVLNKIADNQSVDTEKLEQLLAQLTHTSKRLYASTGKIGAHVMESDLFQSIAQRSSIPGGTCSFDLPEFHYWLEQAESNRLKDLEHWRSPFEEIHTAIDLILNFIRNSNSSTDEVAEAGFFQIALDRSLPYQLIKVSLDKSIPCFAEISGGKHRCSIRFMIPSSDDKRPIQSQDDIPFALTCCLF
ncbi:Cell division protein ZapD [Candidatus Methylobacter favarea]|uniref:Cell division protein ZapD n=1 Tax=Candidatus Methylobacter favarea TaxID=2707345 RepID=A0A8S0XHM7_9GAMM|nr:cell division protein ZapD [Candidatus Methylobacter favarea]CAA9889871.1 Cell division protein ZapD [Candidatus Methylobacter favarea]